jgi:hypothetical protein
MSITVVVREAGFRGKAVVHHASLCFLMVCVCTQSYSVVLVCACLTSCVCAMLYSVMLQCSVIDCLTLC